MCSAPVTFGGGAGMTKDFSLPRMGSKNPDFSHQAYQADSTAAGLYALRAGESNACRRFFSPRGVSSRYVVSTGAALTFFSFFGALAAFAASSAVGHTSQHAVYKVARPENIPFARCLASNLACFAAFSAAFLSTRASQPSGTSTQLDGGHVRSFSFIGRISPDLASMTCPSGTGV